MNYKKIVLSSFSGDKQSADGYELNPEEKYLLVNFKKELESQTAILMAFQIMGKPPALLNYHSWLFKNGFSVECPNPTNEFVSEYYGVKPLWKTEYSQGVVVKVENNDGYFIIMECSRKNKGYRHTKVLLTPSGCL